MSTYLLLEDHWIGNNYLPAGSTQTTADIGGLLPTGWVPTPNVDPLDAAAVAAFYAAGPVLPGPTQLRPTTRWTRVPADFSSADFSGTDFYAGSAGNTWVLTGLGANTITYPAINI